MTTIAEDKGPKRAEEQIPKRYPWVPGAAAWACLIIGLLDIAGAIMPRLRTRWFYDLADYLPGTVVSAANAATLVVGILLVLLAHALRRRKRRAWVAVVVLLGLSVIFHAVRHEGLVGLTIALVLLIGLLVFRKEFYAVADPISRWWSLGMFIGLFLTSVVLGLAIVSVRPGALEDSPGLGERLQHVLYGMVGVTGPLQFNSGRVEDLVSASLFGLGLVTLLTAVYLFFRPAHPIARLSPADETGIRELLAKQGHRDSLGYFATRRDKSVIWSPTGKSCVTYRVVSGVMLASGDPLGDPEAWPGAIKLFMEMADRHAWAPAVAGCSETGGEIWCREGGLNALEIGDEAICEVADFTLEGRAMRNVRQMVNRIERQGYTTRIDRVKTLSAEEVQLIARRTADWRGAGTERGFSMALSRFGDPADGECVTVRAFDKDGQMRAFLHFVPWGKDGLSLDLMRRDREAEPGLNELLIVAALRQSPTIGVKRLSLNFATFRSSLERGERLGAGPIIKTWSRLLIFASRWFQIESLYRFNAKFRPIWEPRFVLYRNTAETPRIGIAYLKAEAFIVTPKLPKLRGRNDEEAGQTAGQPVVHA